MPIGQRDDDNFVVELPSFEGDLVNSRVAMQLLSRSSSFVILLILNTNIYQHYLRILVQVMRLLTSDGIEQAQHLIVPVFNEGIGDSAEMDNILKRTRNDLSLYVTDPQEFRAAQRLRMQLKNYQKVNLKNG